MNLNKIVASGIGPFPIDMLRFCEAWPATSNDAALIQNNTTPDALRRIEVTMLTYREMGQHLLQRWESFGWTATTDAVPAEPMRGDGTPLRAGQEWTAADDKAIADGLCAKRPTADIARDLQRTRFGVEQRAIRLGLMNPRHGAIGFARSES
jgi:hypothetical protein